VVAITIAIARRVVGIIDIPVVVHRDARASVVVAIVVTAVVRVAPVAWVVNMQVMIRPADREGGRYAPEIP